MQTRKLESMIHDAIEDAIWQYEYQEKEKVDNIDISISGDVQGGELTLFVDVDEYDEDN